MYQGDIRLGDTIDWKFTTRKFSTGAPFTLAGSPSLAAYVGNGTTEITSGLTLSVDFDGVTGLNNVRVVATSGNGFATATNISVSIAAGTVDSVSVVGEVIGSFSIENRSALMPTIAARTVDVTATGAAGIDWGNIENPTTAQNLSATNIDVDQIVASVSGAVGSVTGNVGGNVVGSVGSVAGNVTGSVGSVVGAVGSVTGAVGSVTGNVGGNVTGSVGSVLGSVDSVTDPVTVGTNNDKTGYAIGTGGITSASFAANAIDSAALANSAGQELADRFLARGLQTGADGPRTVQDALRASRNRVSIDALGNTIIYQEDDTTPAWIGTATRDAAADPITEIDPA